MQKGLRNASIATTLAAMVVALGIPTATAANDPSGCTTTLETCTFECPPQGLVELRVEGPGGAQGSVACGTNSGYSGYISVMTMKCYADDTECTGHFANVLGGTQGQCSVQFATRVTCTVVTL